MKLTLRKDAFFSKRFLGRDDQIIIDRDFFKYYSALLNKLIHTQGLQLVGKKIYFEIFDKAKLQGPYFEIQGQNSSHELDLKTFDLLDGHEFVVQVQDMNGELETLGHHLDGIFKQAELISSKITFKKAFLTLEFDKIELHFFDY